MPPPIGERGGIERAEPRPYRGTGEETRSGRNEQPNRILDWVNLIEQVFGLDEVEQLQIVLERGPRRERHERRAEGDPGAPNRVERTRHVGAAVTLLEVREHDVGERLDRRHDEQAAGRSELGEQRPVLEQVLYLGGEVVGHVRELRVQLADQPAGVPRAVQEVGIPESDVPRPGGDEPADVLEHDVARDGEEAPAVHRRDRAVEALVQAPAARLDVPSGNEPAAVREAHVTRERLESRPARDGEVEPRERGAGRRRRCPALPDLVNRREQRDELGLDFAAEHRARAVRAQVVGVEQRVEAVKHDPARGIDPADPLGGADADRERSVHRHGDRGHAGAPHLHLGEGIEGEIHHVRGKSRPLEKRLRPGETKGLVAQLVTGDEEDGARGAERRVGCEAHAAK